MIKCSQKAHQLKNFELVGFYQFKFQIPTALGSNSILMIEKNVLKIRLKILSNLRAGAEYLSFLLPKRDMNQRSN